MGLSFDNWAIEWWLATTTFGFGIFLGQRAAVMDTPPYQQLTTWFPEPAWALFFVLSGTLHLLALAINGQAWWTPLVRALVAAMNAAVFCLFSAGFVLVAPHTTAVFAFPAFAVAGFICFYRAMKDVEHAFARWNAHA